MSSLPDSVAPAPRKHLKDADIEVRHDCAEALLKLGTDKEVLDVFFEELKDETRRCRAAEILGRCGPSARAAVPTLMEMLKSLDPTDRAAAADGLMEIGPDSADASPSSSNCVTIRSRLYAKPRPGL